MLLVARGEERYGERFEERFGERFGGSGEVLKSYVGSNMIQLSSLSICKLDMTGTLIKSYGNCDTIEFTYMEHVIERNKP